MTENVENIVFQLPSFEDQHSSIFHIKTKLGNVINRTFKTVLL